MDDDLLKRQSSALAALAKDFLLDRKFAESLAVAARVPMPNEGNLSTIAMASLKSFDEDIHRNAVRIFENQLMLFTRSVAFAHMWWWVSKRKRSSPNLEHFAALLCKRRLQLEPNWDGVWDNPYQHQNDILRELVGTARVEEVTDPDLCLKIAAQVRKNQVPKWVQRYFDTGGRADNPQYLKFQIAKSYVHDRNVVPEDVKKALRGYVATAPVSEVRKFLRSMTPRRRGSGVLEPNKVLGRYALLVYSSCERINHTTEDWVHIAQSSLYCEHVQLQRIAQRGLAGCRRDTVAQNIFAELTRLHGEIRVTVDPRQDIGARGNPIWSRIYHAIPVNADARRILVSYSSAEIHDSAS